MTDHRVDRRGQKRVEISVAESQRDVAEAGDCVALAADDVPGERLVFPELETGAACRDDDEAWNECESKEPNQNSAIKRCRRLPIGSFPSQLVGTGRPEAGRCRPRQGSEQLDGV